MFNLIKSANERWRQYRWQQGLREAKVKKRGPLAPASILFGNETAEVTEQDVRRELEELGATEEERLFDEILEKLRVLLTRHWGRISSRYPNAFFPPSYQ